MLTAALEAMPNSREAMVHYRLWYWAKGVGGAGGTVRVLGSYL